MDKNKGINSLSLSVADMVGLRRFVEDPKKYDKRPFKEGSTTTYGSNYYCSSTIFNAADGIKTACPVKLLKAPSFERAIEASSNEDVGKYIKEAYKEEEVL
jgi:hypothetical protein